MCRKEDQIQLLETEMDQERRMADNLVNDMVRYVLIFSKTQDLISLYTHHFARLVVYFNGFSDRNRLIKNIKIQFLRRYHTLQNIIHTRLSILTSSLVTGTLLTHI